MFAEILGSVKERPHAWVSGLQVHVFRVSGFGVSGGTQDLITLIKTQDCQV